MNNEQGVTSPPVISRDNAEHYVWGAGCDIMSTHFISPFLPKQRLIRSGFDFVFVHGMIPYPRSISKPKSR
jgi:hypothetical protein